VGVAILVYTFTGHAVFSSPQPETTSNNAEGNIRKWAAALGLGIQPISVPDTDFALKVSLLDGNPVVVSRFIKDSPGFIRFGVNVVLVPEHVVALGKLDEQQALDVTEEVALELDRSRIQYAFVGAPRISNIGLSKAIRIHDLTEDSFKGALDELDSDLGVVRWSLALALRKQQSVAITPLSTQRH
jgi:hypothetical protein